MKKHIFICLVFLGSSVSYSQDTTYYSSYSTLSASYDERLFYTINSSDDSLLMYFVESNQLALRSARIGDRLDGVLEKFYPNGQLFQQSKYNYGARSDTIIRWYQNGELMGKFYPNKLKSEGENNNELVISFYDSLGNQTVKNGRGYFSYKSSINGEFESGEVLEGLKIGTWAGGNKKMKFEEKFEKGIFQSGVSWDKQGRKYTYVKIQEDAYFNGGVAKFYKFLSKKLKYPKGAKNNNIEGQVVVSFTVNKNGTITDFKLVKGIHPDYDREAIRVLSKSPKWIPAKVRGQVVSSKMVYSVNFF